MMAQDPLITFSLPCPSLVPCSGFPGACELCPSAAAHQLHFPRVWCGLEPVCPSSLLQQNCPSPTIEHSSREVFHTPPLTCPM